MVRFYKVVDFIALYRNSLIGIGVLCFMGRKLGGSMKELEHNTTQFKVYDPRKAKA